MTNPVRVALVTPRFPPDVGGLEGYVGWVAQTLQSSGRFEVTVITTGTSRRMTQTSWQGIPVFRLGTWLTVSNTPLNPLWWVQVRRLLTRLDIDVVNAHAPVPGLADIAALTSPVPVVMTYHSGSMVKGGHSVDALLRAYERHLLPRVFDRCAELVAVSPISMAHATGRAHLVPPGVDTDLFAPTGKEREPRVLYVGRVERTSRWKGLDVLLDSLVGLRERVPGVRLDVVGDGDDVIRLQARAAELDLAGCIDWHGSVPHEELPDYYRRAGVTVLPSLTESESFGMTLVEAMASGCPVVGSDVGGIPFVVREGIDGLLAQPGDPVALADALAGVLTEPARAAALGAAGREAATSRWDWRHQATRTIQVIEKTARPEGSPYREGEGVVNASVGTSVEALRSRIPRALLPVVVAARFRAAWSRESVRAHAREQMAFLLEHTRPGADLDLAARGYLRHQIWRGELRWHPEIVTRQRVVGIEHLLAARDGGRGVVLNFMHHGPYDGAFPSLARLGVQCRMMVHPYMVREDTPTWLKQHVKVACFGGGQPVSSDIGSQGIIDLLGEGHVVAIASDVPGRTPLTFVGREVLGSYGAARLAAAAAAPVVVMTAERDAGGPVVRLHEPLYPEDFASPRELLERMLAIQERAIVAWPEATDLPNTRWGAVEEIAAVA